MHLIESRKDRHGALIGHDVGFSTKCHCECAGHGIEYGNGRSKWWFRSHCTENASDMKDLALESMSGKVIKLAHAMKFARKARDFFRAYRMGACGGEVEKQRRQFAAHRCMLDCYLKFVSEE